MSTAFSLPRKPLSLNAKLSKGYAESIIAAAKEKHFGELLRGPLYSRILWFHKVPNSQGDVDNIAKKIHDSLKYVVFDDDRLITHSLALRVDASVQVDLVGDADNPESFAELAELLADPGILHVLYIEIGLQPRRRIHLGPVTP